MKSRFKFLRLIYSSLVLFLLGNLYLNEKILTEITNTDNQLQYFIIGSVLCVIGANVFSKARFLFLLNWFLVVYVFSLFPHLFDVSFGFLGFMTFVFTLVHENDDDFFEAISFLYEKIWIVFAAVYFVSGVFKCYSSPSWIQGRALELIFENDFFIRNNILQSLIPDFVLKFLTWFVLVLELFAPLVLIFKRARYYFLIPLTLMHIGIFIFLDFGILSLVMILFHLLFFTLKDSDSHHKQTDNQG